MKIVFSKQAKRELRIIHRYYFLQANSTVAEHIKKEIIDSIKTLSLQPESGRLAEELKHLKLDYRKIICGHFKVFYRISNDFVFIAKIFDSRQDADKINL